MISTPETRAHWANVHLTADKRPPVNLPDTKPRNWAGYGASVVKLGRAG